MVKVQEGREVLGRNSYDLDNWEARGGAESSS